MIAISDQRAATVAELSCRHGLDLLRFAYLLCGDKQRAEDLLQDVSIPPNAGVSLPKRCSKIA